MRGDCFGQAPFEGFVHVETCDLIRGYAMVAVIHNGQVFHELQPFHGHAYLDPAGAPVGVVVPPLRVLVYRAGGRRVEFVQPLPGPRPTDIVEGVASFALLLLDVVKVEGYGKVEVGYPFELNLGNLNPMLNGFIIPQFRVKELFTDFNIGEHSYFRFGKHTVTWGVGYFFSPADVINIGKIDPENPVNQVEGAISLRSMFTFPGTQNCLYLYLIPTGMEEGFLARNTAFAGKYDFLLGNTEIGIGGWYKYNRSPRLVSTLTSTIFRDVSVFGEVVFAYGTEEQWIASKSFENKDFVLQGTFGFSKYFKNPKINLASQYLFNGFGENDPTSLVDEKFLTKQGLYGYVGKHFLALSLTKSELFTEKLSLSGFCLMSFSDFSGMANLSLNYNLDKNCNISLGPNLVFGKENSEFARTSEKNMFSFDVSVKLGGGKF